MYLLWYDDSKTPAAQKLENAREAYYLRFQRYPTVAMVNERDVTEREDMTVQVQTYVRPNNIWVGVEE